MPGTRKLGRDTAHRLAMLRGLVTFFFENGKIETTATVLSTACTKNGFIG